jgi:hypothetical protein
MEQCGATKLEDVLWFFDGDNGPERALEAALLIRAEIRKYNETHVGLG